MRDDGRARTRPQIFFIAAILSKNMSIRDVIIVGAGPSGLSAAIAAKQRGLDYQVLEQGVLVNSISVSAADGVLHHAGTARNRRPAVRLAVQQADARRSAQYYRRVVDTYDLQIAFDEKVLSIERTRRGR